MIEAQIPPQTSSIYNWLQATTTPSCQNDKFHLSVRPNFRKSQPQRSLKPYWSHNPDPFDSSDDKLQHYLDGVGHGKTLITTHLYDYHTTRDGEECNPYARRPRRRTRADKYILEDNQLNRITLKPQKELPKKSNKRKRQESSGTLLLHRYNAENVLSTRLTLKPISQVGLFSKGRASSASRVTSVQDHVRSENITSCQNPGGCWKFGCPGNHNKCQKIKDTQSPRLRHPSHQEDPNKLVSCSGQNPCIDTSPVRNESIQDGQLRAELCMHSSVNNASHSRVYTLDTQPQETNININSEAAQRQIDRSCLQSPVIAHKIPRQHIRNRTTPNLDQISTSKQDIFRKDVENFHDETVEEKALLGSTMSCELETKNARQSPYDLLRHLDDLVQKWKAEMQQIDVGQVSNDTSEAHPSLKITQEVSGLSNTSEEVLVTLSKGRGKANKELNPSVGNGRQTSEDKQDIVIERPNHGPSKVDNAGVFESLKSIRQRLSFEAAGSFPRPISTSHPLGTMAASSVPIYEQQIRDCQNMLTNDVDLSVSPMWRQDVLSRSSFHSYTGIRPPNPNSSPLGTYPLRCITSANSNIVGAMKLPKNPNLHSGDMDFALCGSPEALESYSMTRAAWNSPIEQRRLSTPQADLRNLEDAYFISDLMSEQSRSGKDTKDHAYIQQDYSQSSNIIAADQEPRNFWTPQKLY